MIQHVESFANADNVAGQYQKLVEIERHLNQASNDFSDSIRAMIAEALFFVVENALFILLSLN